MKFGIESNILRSLLRNVYFINGTAYAGKSTMVRLLSEKHDGIKCGENYHNDLLEHVDAEHQPNLCYIDTMSSWQEFIARSPEAYDAWIQNCALEAAELEIVQLIRLSAQGKKIFVDTNIPVDVLREISDEKHVAIMLSPQSMSVDRFFEREDAEKQFIYQQILQAQNPAAAMENYRKGLALINSPGKYRAFEESGFFIHVRTEDSTIEDTFQKLEKHFGLIPE